MKFEDFKIDWSPFVIVPTGKKAPAPRSLSTPEGLGDRIRFVAFAEMQAHHAFRVAEQVFTDAPKELKDAWAWLSKEEQKHKLWLMRRMEELQISPSEIPQNDALWRSFFRCTDLNSFIEFMASAENWGKTAGEKFTETLRTIDPITSKIFERITFEETLHIHWATPGSPKTVEFSSQVWGLEEYSRFHTS